MHISHAYMCVYIYIFICVYIHIYIMYIPYIMYRYVYVYTYLYIFNIFYFIIIKYFSFSNQHQLARAFEHTFKWQIKATCRFLPTPNHLFVSDSYSHAIERAYSGLCGGSIDGRCLQGLVGVGRSRQPTQGNSICILICIHLLMYIYRVKMFTRRGFLDVKAKYANCSCLFSAKVVV